MSLHDVIPNILKKKIRPCSMVLGASVSHPPTPLILSENPNPMPPISRPFDLLRARSPSLCLFCWSRSPPRSLSAFSVASQNFSISSTSIKAVHPPAVGDGKSAVADGLGQLARAGLAGEARVRLAVRGLEGQDAGVRVAVVGRSGSEGRLVAALLADPLPTVPEERQWIKDLLLWSESLREGRKGGLLIRYGPPSSITTPPGSPISLLSVPSPLLKSSALEILLAPLPSSPEDLSVITLRATEIPGARIVEYPVHKTLFWAGEGPAGLSTLLGQSCTNTGSVLKALSLPGLSTAAAPEEADVKIIDLTIAEDTITQLQTSIQNATTIDHEWIQGGLEAIKRWIVSGTSKSTAGPGVKPAIMALVSSIISEAESLIRREEASIVAVKKTLEGRVSSTSSLAPDNTVTLSRALKEWSQTAHSELQEGLYAAFKNKPWEGLGWWKLLWAADDVTSNLQDVLAVGFLPESKKKLLFLVGRFSGAGYHGNGKRNSPSPPPVSVEEELEKIRKFEQPLSPVPRDIYLGGADYYPPQVFRAIDHIHSEVIPRLQTSANKLLMRAFSVSTTSVVVSGLLYLSEISIYSSSSIAALGVVYSARYLQKEWDKEKKWFQGTVAEKGRIAIVETERWGWERLRVGRDLEERVVVGGGELKKIEEGKKVVEGVKRILEKL